MRNQTGMGRAGCSTRTLVAGVLLSLWACNSGGEAKDEAGKMALHWMKRDQSGALPIRLTGSDGHGLSLVSVRAEAIVQPPLAFTELHLRFQNPENRRREGRFEVTLPAGAAISRFAMRIGDHFQEGEVVERRAAQQAYEDFLHRRQDPALLEQASANQFSARVFPIGPREEKEIILSYSETLSDPADPYRIHLSGLPAMRELAVRVLAGGNELHVAERDFAPRGDLTVTSAAKGEGPDALAVQSGDLLMARVTPKLPSQPAPLTGLTIAFDTSASTALSYRDRVTRLGSLVDALRSEAGKDFPVQLIAFDQTSDEVYAGPASELGRVGLPALNRRMPLGATDLARTLDELAQRVKQPRLLLMGDAVVTAGGRLETDLDGRLVALREHGVQRADVVLLGGIHDEALAERIAGGPFDHAGTVLSEHSPQADLVTALTATVQARLPVSVENASWWWPRTVPSLLPGQSTVVLAKRTGQGPARVTLGSTQAQAEPLTVYRPLLERAWAQARIAELEAELDAMPSEDTAQRATLQAEATALSVRHRVLSRRTALLVLETEGDYARFDIPRSALSDILVVGEQGLDLLTGADRAERLVAFGEPSAEPEAEAKAETEGRVRHRRRGYHAGRPAEPPPMGDPTENRMAAEQAGAGAAQAPRAMADLESEPPPPAGLQAAKPTGNAAEVLRQSTSTGGLGELRTRRERPTRSATKGRRAARGRVRVKSQEATTPPSGDFKAKMQSMVRRRLRAIQICYERELRRAPTLSGDVTVVFTLVPRGNVATANVARNSVGDADVGKCVSRVVRGFRFNPGPEADSTFTYTFHFEPGEVTTQVVSRPPRPRPSPAQLAARRERRAEAAAMRREWESRPGPDLAGALEGKLLEIMVSADAGNTETALLKAWRFRAEAPGDVLSLLGLGYALNAAGDTAQASRAYGSILDLFAGRADLRRMAGNFLERVAQSQGDPQAVQDSLSLAIDTYARAREQRPDHPASHRLYAFALVKRGELEQAFTALREGYGRSYPQGRFAGAKEILADDLRIMANVWRAARPKDRKKVDAALSELDLKADHTPSLRFVLSWETDTNDVDFHLYDGKKGHAYFSRLKLPSGGRLMADVTTGYGPECFRIDRPKAYPYEISAHYYSRGPMGYGMGKVQVVKHDGRGGLTFDERPFVIMKDRAFVHLGTVEKQLGSLQAATSEPQGG